MSKNCESCETNLHVTLAPDPYMDEIHNDPTPVWMCENCRYESAQDI